MALLAEAPAYKAPVEKTVVAMGHASLGLVTADDGLSAHEAEDHDKSESGKGRDRVSEAPL